MIFYHTFLSKLKNLSEMFKLQLNLVTDFYEHIKDIILSERPCTLLNEN